MRYYEAFTILNRGRSQGMSGAEALQVSEILSLGAALEIANLTERGKYLGLMQDLDRVWLKHTAEQINSKQKQPNGRH